MYIVVHMYTIVYIYSMYNYIIQHIQVQSGPTFARVAEKADSVLARRWREGSPIAKPSPVSATCGGWAKMKCKIH